MFVFDDPITKSGDESQYVDMNRVDACDSGLNTDDYIDKELANALSGAFGGSTTAHKAYSVQAAQKGAEFVVAELETMGFSKPKVEILGGNKDALVYAAHLDTRKGRVSVAIPIDTSGGKLLLPSTFVADDCLEELRADKIQYFIDKKAFNNDFSMPNAESVLKAIGIVTGQEKTATDDEFKQTIERFDERGHMVQITSPELFAERQNHQPKPDIDITRKAEMPKELAHLASSFEDDMLEAASSFGKSAVSSGKHIVATELVSAGFKNAQVRFGSEASDSVVYLASIHTPKGPAEIEVVVEMVATAENKFRPLAPSCFVYQGLMEDFTAPKLQRFALNRPANANGEVVFSSEHSYMLLPELRDEIVKSASQGDYVTCEMILGTIGERFTEEDYKNAIADYQYLLFLKTGSEKEVRKCSREIPAGKYSVATMCGHYNVSMDKVVVGEDGHCKLKTAIASEKLNPVEETGASISTSKVFWS